jgi:hypothetical protein
MKRYTAVATTKLRARAVRISELIAQLNDFERKTVIERAFALLGQRRKVLEPPDVRPSGWQWS